MRNLIFATVLAVAAAAPFAASAQDEIVIRKHHTYSDQSGDNGRRHEESRDWRHRHHDRGRGMQFGLAIGGPDHEWHHRKHHRRDCETRWVKHWRHHHRVVEKVTVCR